MTKQQRAKYLKSPNHCPKCNSKNISGGSFEADDDYAYRDVTCDDCGYEFRDIYTLADVEEVK